MKTNLNSLTFIAKCTNVATAHNAYCSGLPIITVAENLRTGK